MSSPALTIYMPTTQQERFPTAPRWFPYKPYQLHLVLNLMGLTCLPATKLFKQANHRLLRKSKVTSPSSHYTACPPQCLLVHAAPEYSLHVALRGLQHPALLGCEHMWRINWCQSHLPSVRYQAFSHFRLFRAEDPSITNRVNRR